MALLVRESKSDALSHPSAFPLPASVLEVLYSLFPGFDIERGGFASVNSTSFLPPISQGLKIMEGIRWLPSAPVLRITHPLDKIPDPFREGALC
jgi:hypothetical protein